MSDSVFDLSREVEELFKAKMQEFFRFCEKDWGMCPKEAAENGHPPEFATGWEAAMESLPAALECWIEAYPV